MNTRQDHNTSAEGRFIPILCVMLMVVALKAVLGLQGSTPIDLLADSDNDDIMRLLSVRDWMAGQSWFDMHQYRMVPPEGVDLHWSRYLDLAIASAIRVLSIVLPQPIAEGAALVVWPALLYGALIVVASLTARRVFGPAVGIATAMGLILWFPLGRSYFQTARMDHHNIQILLMTVMLAGMIWPERARLAGAIGGAAVAMSMTLGLEMLPTIGAAGVYLLVQAVIARQAERLVWFSGTLAVAATALFAGQTPPDAWLMTQCDESSVPFVLLAWVAAGISLAVMAMTQRIGSLPLRAAATLALSIAGLAAIFPILQPCLGGPYGDLPERVNHMISNRIVEAYPAFAALRAGIASTFVLVFPTALVTVIGTVLWALRGRDKALGIVLLFAWLGVAGCLYQTRLILLGAASYPLLTGVIFAAAADVFIARDRAKALLIIAAAAIVLQAPALFIRANNGTGAGLEEAQAAGLIRKDDCRAPDLIRTLNSVPKGVILAYSNDSAPILLLTHHSVVTGPYHRSPDAMGDGVFAFDGPEADLREAVKRIDPDYLLLCRGALYGEADSFVTALAGGAADPGFTPVDGPAPELLLLKRIKPGELGS